MKKPVLILWIAVILFTACNSINSKNEEQVQKDISEIEQIIGNYKVSINQADTTLAATFWLPTTDVSFIHPRSHEKGWEEIKSGIYGMFGSRFSKRDLKSYNESIQLYGDMAVVEFYWVFDATYSGENPDTMQSKGRETQVMKKYGNDWKIVHVHYSGMPRTGEREGF